MEAPQRELSQQAKQVSHTQARLEVALVEQAGVPSMTDAIEAGSIHIEEGEHLPKFLVLQSESESLLSGWALVTNIRSTLEEQVKRAGWVFFFMAGKIETTAFWLDKRKTLGAALNRLTTSVKFQKCNSFEIMQVTSKQFLGVFRVSVSAHACHLQKGSVCFGQ